MRGPFGPLDPYRLETTELGVTDDLYAPCGAIARAEALAARCASAAHTLMLTGGSTAGVQAMLLYAAGGGGAVVLPRNAHLSALHLCAVAGLDVVFARPSFTASGLCYTPDESYLEALERRPDARALLVVRPDYYGALHWPARAAARARALGIPVLCDEAHGAHLNWDAETPTAGALGADVWVQSAHKTLLALNGGAWLHAGPGMDAARLRAMLRAVQSSSPSFVTLLALDDARAWMEQNGAEAVARLKAAAARFHARAAALGYDTVVIFGDPANYVSRGFKSCKKHNVCLPDGSFPAGMLVKELVPGALAGKKWVYRQSPVFEFDEQEALRFDASLPEQPEKRVLPCQETFYILSSAVLP